MVLTKDEKQLISGGGDGIIKIHDIESKQEVFSFEKIYPGKILSQKLLKWSLGSIMNLFLIEDGKKLVALLNYGTINIYDLASKELLHSFGEIESNFKIWNQCEPFP